MEMSTGACICTESPESGLADSVACHRMGAEKKKFFYYWIHESTIMVLPWLCSQLLLNQLQALHLSFLASENSLCSHLVHALNFQIIPSHLSYAQASELVLKTAL